MLHEPRASDVTNANATSLIPFTEFPLPWCCVEWVPYLCGEIFLAETTFPKERKDFAGAELVFFSTSISCREEEKYHSAAPATHADRNSF